MSRLTLFILLVFVLPSALAQNILVPPYIQPGNVSTLAKEEKVIIWQTDSIPGTFKVEFALGSSLASVKKPSTTKVSSVKLSLLTKQPSYTGLHYPNYNLPKLMYTRFL